MAGAATLGGELRLTLAGGDEGDAGAPSSRASPPAALVSAFNAGDANHRAELPDLAATVTGG